MSANPVEHQQTKHVELDIHFVRDKVVIGHIRVLHVPSRHQYANIFTKGLTFSLFSEFRSSLSIQEPPPQTAGTYLPFRAQPILVFVFYIFVYNE